MIAGIVLAGGLGTRMGGTDKALMPLAGRPMLAHALARLAPQVPLLAISANGDPARFAAFGLPVLADGVPGFYMFGHGASLKDPYAAFELFDGKYSASIGTSAGNNRFSRYNNPEYDAIMNKMAPLNPDSEEFHKLAVQALEIYWRDQIDVPIIQWLHRIPYNSTYWTNWPSASNLSRGENGAFWAHTGLLVVTGLKPAQ